METVVGKRAWETPVFSDTMTQAMDEMYLHYAEQLKELNGHLDHLLEHPDLTPDEQIDRHLLEAWMALVHKHNITSDPKVFENIRAALY